MTQWRAWSLLVSLVVVGGCIVGDSEEDPQIDGTVGLVWPSSTSSANSDPWLRQHHAQIKELRPNVLILVANNQMSLDFIKRKATATIAAFAEASRYHGYSDSKASPQLNYQIAKIVDMRDGNPRGYPADWPTRTGADGKVTFNYEGLFTQSFASHYGYLDPDIESVGRYLNLCELFERGVINELWVSAPRTDAYGKLDPRNGNPLGVYETRQRIQLYNDNGTPKVGEFYSRDWDPGTAGRCKVTVKLSEFATDQNDAAASGGDLHAKGHGMEITRDAIPEYRKTSARFFHMDLDTRYGASFKDEYGACPYFKGACWSYPDNNKMVSTPLATTAHFDQWSAGCGNVHFPPNATTHYDYTNTTYVDTTCAHYGIRVDASRPGEIRTGYGHISEAEKSIADYEARFGRDVNGGGWLVYMMQSFPGYANKATGDDGKPMKSWWPFFYY